MGITVEPPSSSTAVSKINATIKIGLFKTKDCSHSRKQNLLSQNFRQVSSKCRVIELVKKNAIYCSQTILKLCASKVSSVFDKN
jgi:hypothetical protein